MRVVSIREFQRTLYDQIANLPVIVTRRANKRKGHPIDTAFVVIPYRSDLVISQDASDIDLKNNEEIKEEKRGLFGLFKK